MCTAPTKQIINFIMFIMLIATPNINCKLNKQSSEYQCLKLLQCNKPAAQAQTLSEATPPKGKIHPESTLFNCLGVAAQ